MRQALRRHSAVFLALALGCDHPLIDPPLPATASAFTPPAVYATWWKLTQACAGYGPRTDRAISWYVIPGDTIPSGGVPGLDIPGGVSGYWSSASNRIVLASAVVLDGPTVRHEMLHAIARNAGHSRAMFLERCAGVVACDGACLTDAATASNFPTTARHLPTDSLSISVRVEPGEPSLSKDDGFFVVRVTVTNRRDEPVVADVEPTALFLYQLSRADNSGIQDVVKLRDSSTVRFGPHESKQQLFDVRVTTGATDRDFGPGEYTVFVMYGSASSTINVRFRP